MNDVIPVEESLFVSGADMHSRRYKKKGEKGFVELTFFLGRMLIMESSKKGFLQQGTSIYTQQEVAIQMTSASSDYDLKKINMTSASSDYDLIS